jgi:hypothetical protein
MEYFDINISSGTRPERTKGKKDKQYDLAMGRYFTDKGNSNYYQEWVRQSYINAQFWLNNQWIHQEDLEAFFKDLSMQSRNRIKVINNFIKPIVEQYRGNAEIMDISASVTPTSTRAINRREEELSRLLFMTKVAEDNPQIEGALREQFPIGKDQQDTELMFENLYQDRYVEAVNGIMEYVAKQNQLERYKSDLALDMALTGKCVMKYDFDDRKMHWRRIEPECHIFDSGSVKSDLSDSEFHGHIEHTIPAEIFEQYDISETDRKTIEEYVQQRQGVNTDRVPVIHMYWKDYDVKEYGYVKDDFGYVTLSKINCEQDDLEKNYTDEDLVPLSELTPKQKKVCNGSNKKSIPMDVIRYVVFIPHEAVKTNKSSADKVKDIVCSHGVMPYQDTTTAEYQDCEFPYKCGTWIYYRGKVDSPISALINPQRMINRYASVMENLMNNMKGSSIAYDKDAVGDTDEAEFLSNYYQSKPLGLKARRTGIHNVVTEMNPKLEGARQYADLMSIQKDFMDRIIGVNESLQGQSVSANQLVGVTQSQIQRGSLIQEPFYASLADVYMQMFQAIVNAGKRFYVKRERELAIMVGDNMTKVLQLSQDLNAEDFRVFVKRQPNIDNQIQIGNQLLISWITAGLIDEVTFAELFNRSTPEQVARRFREVAKTRAESQRQQAEIEGQAAQERAMMDAQNQQSMMQQQMQEKEMDRISGQQKEQTRADAKIESELIKASAKNMTGGVE